MEYSQVLCFLGEIYKDLEQPEDAVDALDRAIRLHEVICERESTSNSSAMVSGVPMAGRMDQLTLERTNIMKILAEEQIKSGQVNKGIQTAEGALLLQKEFYGVTNLTVQVQDTMHFLADAYTYSGQKEKAIATYRKLL